MHRMLEQCSLLPLWRPDREGSTGAARHWTVVAQDRGFFKEEYSNLGTQVNLVDPGTQQLVGADAAMLDRGGLSIAQRMVYPGNREGERHRRGGGVWFRALQIRYCIS